MIGIPADNCKRRTKTVMDNGNFSVVLVFHGVLSHWRNLISRADMCRLGFTLPSVEKGVFIHKRQ